MSSFTPKLMYAVTASMAKADLESYVNWLTIGGHVNEVLEHGGALNCQVVILDIADPDRAAVQSVYVFRSREEYDWYDKSSVAAGLRLDGKQKWIDTGKVQFSRTVGDIAAEQVKHNAEKLATAKAAGEEDIDEDGF